MKPSGNLVLACAAVTVCLCGSSVEATAAKKAKKTKLTVAFFTLTGDAPEEAKATVMAILEPVVTATGRRPSEAGAPIQDTAVVLGCMIGEGACRSLIATSLDVDELLYGSLESTSGDTLRLSLTRTGKDGVIRAESSVELPRDSLSRAGGLVADVLTDSKPGKPPSPGMTEATAPGDDSGVALPVTAAAEPAPKTRRKLSAVPFAIGAAGLVVGGIGLGLAIHVSALQSDFDEQVAALGGTDPDLGTLRELDALRRRGEARGAVGAVLAGVGAAALGTGIVLMVLELTRPDAGADTTSLHAGSGPSVRLAPMIGSTTGASFELRW